MKDERGKIKGEIKENDFIDNSTHVGLGIVGLITANNNNFLKVKNYFVWTNKRNKHDTLNFKQNFWNNANEIEISMKIYDKNDRLGQPFEGPVVDIENYRLEKICWVNKM